MRHGTVDASQLAIGTNYRGLFSEEFIPPEADVFKPLLQRKPGVLLPAQAVLDGLAILHQCLLDLLADFARMGSTKSRHLAIPPGAEILAKTLEAEELAPGLVREKCERAQLAACFHMRQDFAGNAFLLSDRRKVGSFRAVLEERLLGVCGFAMNQSHEANELVPRLPVRVAVLAGVNRGEFPLVFAGKRLDRRSQSGRQSFYFSGRVLRSTGLPQVGAQIELVHAETIALAHASLKVLRSRKIVKLRKMT